MPKALQLEDLHHLKTDRKLLEKTKLPIVTVAGSFRDDLTRLYNEDVKPDDSPTFLFSRAHYSMALAAGIAIWKKNVDPKKAWLVDPTNYVNRKDWKKITFTQNVGRAMARIKLLKMLKDFIDTRARNKLPITQAITTTLLYLFEHVHRPILSFHYESGNILAGVGKTVVQVVTDPHVRDQYLEFAQLPSMRFCVFDENTKTSFLEKAETIGKTVDPRRVIVTGPPVDPRISVYNQTKDIKNIGSRPLRLCITTGGLGTNKSEIETCVRSLAPLLREVPAKIQIIVYVGVHQDIRESIHQICRQENIPTSNIKSKDAVMRILYAPHIVEANELLIQYGFPWADGFITKPSGDMAYEAAAAGCFLLTLDPWGEWEHNIRDVFEQLHIGRRAIPENLSEQVHALIKEIDGQSWIETAMKRAQNLPAPFTHGIANILAQMPKN